MQKGRGLRPLIPLEGLQRPLRTCALATLPHSTKTVDKLNACINPWRSYLMRLVCKSVRLSVTTITQVEYYIERSQWLISKHHHFSTNESFVRETLDFFGTYVLWKKQFILNRKIWFFSFHGKVVVSYDFAIAERLINVFYVVKQLVDFIMSLVQLVLSD